MTALKKMAFTSVALALTTAQALATDGSTLFGKGKVTSDTGAAGELTATIQKLISAFLGILAVVAVLFGIYAGFLMVTAGGDEEKVKRGRTIMIQVAIGLVVIFLANSAVRWFIGLIAG